MKRTLTAAFSLLLVISLSEQISMAQQDKGKPGLHLTATQEVAAAISSGRARERTTGRVSFSLITSEDGPKTEVRVKGFNLALFGVPQKLIAGTAPVRDPLGFLGFAVVSGKQQSLRYDAQKGQITGELQMYADASFLSAFAESVQDAKNDLFDTPTLPATATIRIDLNKPLGETKHEPSRVQATLDIQLRIRASKYKNFDFPGFEVRLIDGVILPVEVSPFIFFESARKLCVQPVNLLRLQSRGFPFPFFSFELTGAGLSFGTPGARREWAKADVVFEIREWKTFFAPNLFVMTDSEKDTVRALLDDDDCIEVFFVHDFSPAEMDGGGVTFGAGKGTSQVISSDGNARGGIDVTHLAHELGHVLGLRHPDAPATDSAQPANTGTLMCPSGFLRDNPRVNSQENKDMVSNPLLTFTIKPRGPGPDCLNSADCGACP